MVLIKWTLSGSGIGRYWQIFYHIGFRRYKIYSEWFLSNGHYQVVALSMLQRVVDRAIQVNGAARQ